MAKRMIQFTVTAPHAEYFPLDMLRYDGCFPASLDAVAEMSTAVMSRYSADGKGGRALYEANGFRIQLISSHEPTRDRWLSFGWNVTDIRKV